MSHISDSAVERLREAVDHPEPGERYIVHELLGRGGMGVVYRATDTVLERDVALKVITSTADSPEMASRLAKEARVLARLEHPGIVSVHDAGLLEDGGPFYVMRLVNGKRLDEYSRTATRGDLLRAYLRICDAVGYAHARGVIHRDLKPANIMVGEFGEVLVLDWGVAKIAGELDAFIVGTRDFMAPEQAAGADAVDSRADIFGLGVILKRLVDATGKPARPLAAIADRASAPDPDARYKTVDALSDDIRHWLDGEPVGAYREPALEKIGRLYRRNQALVLLLLAYAIVRVTLLLWRGI